MATPGQAADNLRTAYHALTDTVTAALRVYHGDAGRIGEVRAQVVALQNAARVVRLSKYARYSSTIQTAAIAYALVHTRGVFSSGGQPFQHASRARQCHTS